MERLAFGVAVTIIVTIFNLLFLGIKIILSILFKILKIIFNVFLWATKFPGTRYAQDKSVNELEQ